MSKKKNNNIENIVETPAKEVSYIPEYPKDIVDITEEKVEEATEDNSNDIAEAETKAQDAAVQEEVKEVEISSEEPTNVEENTVEAPAEESITEEKVEEATEDNSNDIAEAVEESPIGVTYYVQINSDPYTDDKLKTVEERLKKHNLEYTVDATGIVLVGPYITKEGAINGRKMVVRCGLKGIVIDRCI